MTTTETKPEPTKNQLANPPPLSPVAKWLAENEQKLAEILPSIVTPKRFIRVALTVYNKNPKLAECNPASVIECLLSCAQIGLETDDARGLAYLIPYDKKCTLVIGYKGFALLAYRSGMVANIEPRIVREFDEFDVRYGTDSGIRHVPRLVTDAGKATAVYCVVTLKDGSKHFEVMTMEQVNAIKERSSGYIAYKKGWAKSSPWVSDFEEMAKKTVFKREAKYLPLSDEFQQAVAIDNEYELERDNNGGFEVKKPVMDATFLKPAAPTPMPSTEPGVEGKPVTVEDAQEILDQQKAARAEREKQESAQAAQPSTENLDDKPNIKW